LARSINRILELDQKRSERWRGISTKSRRYGMRIRQPPVLSPPAMRTFCLATSASFGI
jgi:hypothetical protein